MECKAIPSGGGHARGADRAQLQALTGLCSSLPNYSQMLQGLHLQEILTSSSSCETSPLGHLPLLVFHPRDRGIE